MSAEQKEPVKRRVALKIIKLGMRKTIREQEPVRPSTKLATLQAEELTTTAARRPLETRFRYSFIHTYKPVLDDARFRAFDAMADCRRWCEENLPDWLGYGRV